MIRHVGSLCFVRNTVVFFTLVVFSGLNFAYTNEASERILQLQSMLHTSRAYANIIEDSTGFIWLAGDTGLFRFDGIELKSYPANSYSNTLSSDFVRHMAVDQDKVLWIATDRGIGFYDSKMDRIEKITWDSATYELQDVRELITSLAIDQENNVIVGSVLGLRILSRQDNTLYDIPLRNSVGTALTPVQTLMVDQQNRLWVGTRDQGLYLLNAQRDIVRHFEAMPGDEAALQSNSIKSLAQDGNGHIWVGTYAGGVSKLNADGQSFTSFYRPTVKQRRFQSIWDIHIDAHDGIWIAADQGGLGYFNPQNQHFEPVQLTLNDGSPLASQQVRHIFADSNDNLWFSLFPSGVFMLPRRQQYVQHLSRANIALSSNAISALLPKSAEQMWVATENGLNLLATANHQLETLPKVAQVLDTSILALCDGGNGTLWVGTWSEGLQKIDLRQQRMQRYFPDRRNPHSLTSAFVRVIYRDSRNDLWVGTETGGLNRYDPNLDGFINYAHDQWNTQTLSSNFIWSILEDSQGRFWIGTANGVDLMDRGSGQFQRLAAPGAMKEEQTNPLEGIRGRALWEDTKGNIWIGTQDNGALLYESQTGDVTKLDWPEALSPTVNGFAEDPAGFIWATTPAGLARIDPYQMRVRSFKQNDGLLGEQFHRGAIAAADNGYIYVGSALGISYFDPMAFAAEAPSFPVLLTQIQLSQGHIIESADPQSVPLAGRQNLTLTAGQNSFRIFFAGLNFGHADEIKYAYRLTGFDTDWHHAGAKHFAVYNALSPGTYTFSVKAANRDGVWSAHQAHISIVIQAPYWNQVKLISLIGASVALLLLLLSYLVWRLRRFTRLGITSARDLEQLKRQRSYLNTIPSTWHLPQNFLLERFKAVVQTHLIEVPTEAMARFKMAVHLSEQLGQWMAQLIDQPNTLTAGSTTEALFIPTLVQSVYQSLLPMVNKQSFVLDNQVKGEIPRVWSNRSALSWALLVILAWWIQQRFCGRISFTGTPEADYFWLGVNMSSTQDPIDKLDTAEFDSLLEELKSLLALSDNLMSWEKNESFKVKIGLPWSDE